MQPRHLRKIGECVLFGTRATNHLFVRCWTAQSSEHSLRGRRRARADETSRSPCSLHSARAAVLTAGRWGRRSRRGRRHFGATGSAPDLIHRQGSWTPRAPALPDLRQPTGADSDGRIRGGPEPGHRSRQPAARPPQPERRARARRMSRHGLGRPALRRGIGPLMRAGWVARGDLSGISSPVAESRSLRVDGCAVRVGSHDRRVAHPAPLGAGAEPESGARRGQAATALARVMPNLARGQSRRVQPRRQCRGQMCVAVCALPSNPICIAASPRRRVAAPSFAFVGDLLMGSPSSESLSSSGSGDRVKAAT